MQDKLRAMIKWFEKRVDEVENDYMEKHKDDFDFAKMKKYANRKLKKERQILIQMNISPAINLVGNRKV